MREPQPRPSEERSVESTTREVAETPSLLDAVVDTPRQDTTLAPAAEPFAPVRGAAPARAVEPPGTGATPLFDVAWPSRVRAAGRALGAPTRARRVTPLAPVRTIAPVASSARADAAPWQWPATPPAASAPLAAPAPLALEQLELAQARRFMLFGLGMIAIAAVTLVAVVIADATTAAAAIAAPLAR